MHGWPLFELLVVKLSSKLFIYITYIGSEAAYIHFLYDFLTVPFMFLKRLLHEILPV